MSMLFWEKDISYLWTIFCQLKVHWMRMLSLLVSCVLIEGEIYSKILYIIALLTSEIRRENQSCKTCSSSLENNQISIKTLSFKSWLSYMRARKANLLKRITSSIRSVDILTVWRRCFKYIRKHLVTLTRNLTNLSKGDKIERTLATTSSRRCKNTIKQRKLRKSRNKKKLPRLNPKKRRKRKNLLKKRERNWILKTYTSLIKWYNKIWKKRMRTSEL